MKRAGDRRDLIIALGLMAGVAAWAWIWAYPCPHPDYWPWLAAVEGKVSLTALGVAGRLALGALAALGYLVLRGYWNLHRDDNDDLADEFCFTRLAPICGAIIVATHPYVWRAGQWLSPGLLLFVLTLLGLCAWLAGRGGRKLLVCIFAYLLLGVVSGGHPLGLVVLLLAAGSDGVLRWQDAQAHDQREDDALVRRKRAVEAWFSWVAALGGLWLGAGMLWMLSAADGVTPAGTARIGAWWSGWSGLAVTAWRSPEILALGLAVALAAVGLAGGRRLRSLGPYGRLPSRVLATLLVAVALVMMLRAVNRPTRQRLQLFREYAALVAADAEGVKYLFADGRLDDLLRLELAARQPATVVLNTLAVPTPKLAARLRAAAPEPGERAIFEAGGAEVFKAWARERPERLAESAWQLGAGLVRRYQKVRQRTCGSVIRSDEPSRAAVADAADIRFAEWSRRLLAAVERGDDDGGLLGGVDAAVARRLDALLWRAARLAGERAESPSATKAAADAARQLQRRLDELNVSLRSQGEALERMLPTEKLVLTQRESLEVALRRADFQLARRYAGEILASSPTEPSANFALGMACLEDKEYFQATVYLEKVLRVRPAEPAALNNLAIAYLKLKRGAEALKCAEAAAQAHPQSSEIQQTLAEIRRQVEKEQQ